MHFFRRAIADQTEQPLQLIANRIALLMGQDESRLDQASRNPLCMQVIEVRQIEGIKRSSLFSSQFQMMLV
jgi:hypothetical protein